MIKSFLLSVPIIFTLFAGAPAQARNWGLVPGWHVASAGESCGMFAPVKGPGGGEITILKRLDGALFVQVKNPDWRADRGQANQVGFHVDDIIYDGPSTVEPVPSGYIAGFGEAFEDRLRSGLMLTVRRGNEFLGQFSLAGSSAALQQVQTCLSGLQVAPTVASNISVAKLPRPIAAERWIRNGDYPGPALRDKREGTTAFQLLVGADGGVENCRITQTSGHDDLDQATCEAIMRRARFKAGEDGDGNPVEAEFSSKVSWKLP